MARTKQETHTESFEVTDAQTPGLADAANTLMLSEDMDRADIFSAGVDLGRIEALDFIATVANSAIIPIFENVKKSKGWRFITNPENCHGGKFESLDEFCRVKLGKSYRRIQDLVSIRNTIGQDAFEQGEKIGLRLLDYNAIKALPAPKQEMIKEALAEGADLETVTRALRQLAAEDQREIDTLTNEVAEAKSNLEAARLRSKEKTDEIDALKEQLNKKLIAPSELPSDTGEKIRQEAVAILHTAEITLRGTVKDALQALTTHSATTGLPHDDFMSGMLCQLELTLKQLRSEFDIKAMPDGEEIPDWLRTDTSPLSLPYATTEA